MKDGIKLGFAVTIGMFLANAAVKALGVGVMKWGAKDEKFMEYEKEHDPKMYEELKKYQ